MGKGPLRIKGRQYYDIFPNYFSIPPGQANCGSSQEVGHMATQGFERRCRVRASSSKRRIPLPQAQFADAAGIES